MKRLTQKLRSRKGETLTEMLVSIVILGLSISMMVTMIITSTHMTEQATTKDVDYLKELSEAEMQDKQIGSGEIEISTVKIDVDFYGTEGGLKSYKMHE